MCYGFLLTFGKLCCYLATVTVTMVTDRVHNDDTSVVHQLQVKISRSLAMEDVDI